MGYIPEMWQLSGLDCVEVFPNFYCHILLLLLLLLIN
jgi:hypothetical protein